MRLWPFFVFLFLTAAPAQQDVVQPKEVQQPGVQQPAVQSANQPQATIRTTVPLVVVPVSVTDAKGNPIDGLGEEDFVVLDDGQPRKVRVDASDAIIAPLSVVIAVQTSDISQPALLKIRQVGALIAESIAGANGEVAVVGYNSQVTVLRKFTRDPDQVTDTFEDLKPGGGNGGKMVDAIAKAADLLEHRPSEKRPLSRRTVIFVIGETKDRGSEAKLADVIDRTQRLATTIYGLSYSAYASAFTTKGSDYEAPNRAFNPLMAIIEVARLAKGNTMEALVTATGGQRLGFETKHKLENDLLALSKEIHSRYYVSFTPTESDQPVFHRLRITIRSQPAANVHARPGYWTGLEHAPA